MEDGAHKSRVVVIAFTITLAFVFFSTQMSFTGMAVYYVEVHTSDGENTTFNNATMSSGNFLDTTAPEGTYESLIEQADGPNYILKWNYDFNTTYNETQPAEIYVTVRVRTGEKVNMSIYNYTGSGWLYLNETTMINQYENRTSTLSWENSNLTDFVNSNGQMKIAFEDTVKTSDPGPSTLIIDYLAINVTVSPLYDLWFGLVNSTGVQADGENFTRDESGLNVSALWNASGVNSSYVWVNASGLVSEFRVNHTDSNQNWTNHTLDFSNYALFPRGGNVSVRLKAFDDFFQQNYTGTYKWFGLWSNASVGNAGINESANGSVNTIANGTAFKIYCHVSDDYSNESVPGYNVSFYADHSFIGSALSNSTGWASYTHTDGSPSETAYDLRCNITDENGILYVVGSQNSSNLTLNVITDTDNPKINDFWFEHEGTLTNKTNLYANLSVVANITDDTTSVSGVIINVTYPGNENVSWDMTHTSGDIWTFEFDTNYSGRSLNSTGLYSVYFKAYDILNNLNDTAFPSKNGFNVYSNMTINLTGWETDVLYNRGENLTFYALDVNGFVMADANWSLDILKYGESANESSSGEDVTYYNYTLNSSHPVGNWTAWVNVSEMGNNGSTSFTLNVTDQLSVTFTSPTDRVFQPNQALNPMVSVRNAGGDALPWNVTVNLSCRGGGYMTLVRSGDNYILNDPDDSHTCTAAGSYSTAFGISANVTCPYNNSNVLETLSLSTASEDDGSPGGSSPSGSSGTLPVCNCTEWDDVDCGSGNCTVDEMYQERVCTPSGCEDESRCIAMTKCSDIKNFNISTGTDVVEVTQGKNATAIFEVENTGNKKFDLEINLAYDCCEFFPRFDKFELSEKTQITVPIVVHAPLTQEPGEYVLTVKFTEAEFEKMVSVRILVKENEIIQRIENLAILKQEMENELKNFESLGIDVTGLKRRLDELGNSLQRAGSSIDADNIHAMDSYFNEASKVFESLDEIVLPVRIQGFVYKSMLNIIAAIVSLILIIYMLTEVILPPFILKKMLKKLPAAITEQKEVRKKARRDRMKLIINESTCSNIEQKSLAEESKLITRIKETEKEIELLDSRFSTKGLIRWLMTGPRRLVRRKPEQPAASTPKMSSKMAEVQRKLREREKKQS